MGLATSDATLQTIGLSLLSCGPALSYVRTWDSTAAQLSSGVPGATAPSKAGLNATVTIAVSGPATRTVLYADESGALWSFVYKGSSTAPPPYSSYSTPAGLPWALSTNPSAPARSAAYMLTNFLTGEVRTFTSGGGYLADADSYGNRSSLAYSGARVSSLSSTCGTRALTFTYDVATGQVG